MPKSDLWTNDTEIEFFKQALAQFATPEQLFYNLSGGYFAYVPKGSNAEGQTLQSRNALIGKFTENWARNLLYPIAKELDLYAVNGVVCEELGLTRQSSADVAFCTTNSVTQQPDNVRLLFEVKMSIVSNYKFEKRPALFLSLATTKLTKETHRSCVQIQCSKQSASPSIFAFPVLHRPRFR